VVIDPINLGRFATPVLYVLFVMLLPVNMKPWVTLVVCFFAGLVADFFSDTGGMHAFTMVFTAFARIFFLKLLLNKELIEKPLEPNIFNLGYRLFFFYGLAMSFVYHLVFTFLDVATLHYFFVTLGVVLVSTALALILIFLIQLLFYRMKPEV